MRDGLPPSVQMGGHDYPDTAYLMSAYYRTDLLADDFLAGHPEIRQVLIVGQASPILVGALASNA